MNLRVALLVALRGLGVRQLRSALTMLVLIGVAARERSDRHHRNSECTRSGVRDLIAPRPVGAPHYLSDGNLR